MDKDNEAIEASAGPSGISVKASGGAVSRIGHAISDILSVISEPAGLLGDNIRNYRVLRKDSAEAALVRARQIRQNRQQDDTEIPTKILRPWLEGASSEDVDSEDNITELWARLLASSPEGFDSKMATFLDIFTRIGRAEADLMIAMMRGHWGEDGQDPKMMLDMNAGINLNVISSALDSDQVLSLIDVDEDELINNGLSKFSYPQIRFGTLYAVKIATKSGRQVYTRVDRDADVRVEILIREGLFEKLNVTRTFEKFSVTVDYVQAKTLGATLLQTLYPSGPLGGRGL